VAAKIFDGALLNLLVVLVILVSVQGFLIFYPAALFPGLGVVEEDSATGGPRYLARKILKQLRNNFIKIVVKTTLAHYRPAMPFGNRNI